MNTDKYKRALDGIDLHRHCGSVTKVIGLVIESRGPAVSVGDVCYIDTSAGTVVECEVVGFREDNVLLMPFGDMRGVAPGNRVVSSGKPLTIEVGDHLLGRVLDSFGRPQDGRGPLAGGERYTVYGKIPDPMSRPPIDTPLTTGIRAVDGMLTCGRGQRIGVFAGSGVGKSVLLGCIARHCNADVVVVGLVGERGREVRAFIDNNLGEEGLKRAVVVAATSDQPALIRINGALVASTIAEYFRDQGKNVLLVMDSITRVSMAQREVGLAIGEPPATRGYTPSVFALMPRLLERSGTSDKGSITGFYTVLVEQDDMNDPIGDTARSILDGHVVLSRALADAGHYPPIDVLSSISRLMPELITREHLELTYAVREVLATWREAQDLINIGAYQDGSNPKIDRAKKLIGPLSEFLRQGMHENASFEQTVRRLREIMNG